MTQHTYVPAQGKPKTAGLATPAWRCAHCQGKGKRHKVFFVPRKKRDVYEDVKAKIMAIRAMPPDKRAYRDTLLYKETLAVELGVHPDCVVQALARLNREGLVSQRYNRPPHDCRRSKGMDHGPDDSWMGSYYSVRLFDP